MPQSPATLAPTLPSEVLARQEQCITDRGLKHAELKQLLSDGDPISILALAALTYLRWDPNCFRESQNDKQIAHIEYLALQALAVGLGRQRPATSERTNAENTIQAIELVRNLFDLTSIANAIRVLANAEPGTDPQLLDYQIRIQSSSMMIRGSAYPHHIAQVLAGCFGGLEDSLRHSIGFTSDDTIAVATAIQKIYDDRTAQLANEQYARQRELHREAKAARRKGRSTSLPAWVIALPPTEAKQALALIAIEETDAANRILFSPSDVCSRSNIHPDTAQRVLDTFCATRDDYRDDHHAFPVGPHPLIAKPLLKHRNRYLAPVPRNFLEAIRPRLEALLRESDSTLWKRYTRQRASYVERESARLLAAALAGSRSWTNIPWKSPRSEGEIDGLVLADSVCLQIQCKSGRVTDPARRGAPSRMISDLEKIIAEPAAQHESLTRALQVETPEDLGFDVDQSKALRAPLQIKTIVTLDDVIVWATQAHKLRRLSLLPEAGGVPWILSLTDLMVVVDMLKDAGLIHYLTRRQRLERDGRIESHDELDWLGNYISQGLFFDSYFRGEDPPNIVLLPTHTEMLDEWYWYEAQVRTVPTSKPRQDVPNSLRRFVGRLAAERPKHWTLAAIALLEGNQDTREYWSEALDNIGRQIPHQGWSNVSTIFGEIGMTILVDHRQSQYDMRSIVNEYVSDKMAQHGVDTWIFVGEPSDSQLFIKLFNDNGANGVADQFLEPPTGSVE